MSLMTSREMDIGGDIPTRARGTRRKHVTHVVHEGLGSYLSNLEKPIGFQQPRVTLRGCHLLRGFGRVRITIPLGSAHVFSVMALCGTMIDRAPSLRAAAMRALFNRPAMPCFLNAGSTTKRPKSHVGSGRCYRQHGECGCESSRVGAACHVMW